VEQLWSGIIIHQGRKEGRKEGRKKERKKGMKKGKTNFIIHLKHQNSINIKNTCVTSVNQQFKESRLAAAVMQRDLGALVRLARLRVLPKVHHGQIERVDHFVFGEIRQPHIRVTPVGQNGYLK